MYSIVFILICLCTRAPYRVNGARVRVSAKPLTLVRARVLCSLFVRQYGGGGVHGLVHDVINIMEIFVVVLYLGWRLRRVFCVVDWGKDGNFWLSVVCRVLWKCFCNHFVGLVLFACISRLRWLWLLVWFSTVHFLFIEPIHFHTLP